MRAFPVNTTHIGWRVCPCPKKRKASSFGAGSITKGKEKIHKPNNILHIFLPEA
jgi:hypothetical protein